MVGLDNAGFGTIWSRQQVIGFLMVNSVMQGGGSEGGALVISMVLLWWTKVAGEASEVAGEALHCMSFAASSLSFSRISSRDFSGPGPGFRQSCKTFSGILQPVMSFAGRALAQGSRTHTA